MSFKPELAPTGSIFAWMGGYFTQTNNGGSFISVLGNDLNSVDSFLAPMGYRVCAGQEVINENSLIFNSNNRYLPNLTSQRFLMGHTSAGSILNNNDVTIQFLNNTVNTFGTSVTFNKNQISGAVGHTHSQGTYFLKVDPNSTYIYGDLTSGASWDPEQASQANSPTSSSTSARTEGVPLLGSTGNNSTIGWNSSVVTATVNQSNFLASSLNSFVNSFDNRPSYMSIYYIIKIF
jgi:hypothetical protein